MTAWQQHNRAFYFLEQGMTSSSSSTPVARGIGLVIDQWFLEFDAIKLLALAGQDHDENKVGVLLF